MNSVDASPKLVGSASRALMRFTPRFETGGSMRKLSTAVVLTAAALASSSAPAQPAQDQSGQTTETEERRHAPQTNLIGALGLIGLTGMWRNTDNDGYTDDPI